MPAWAHWLVIPGRPRERYPVRSWSVACGGTDSRHFAALPLLALTGVVWRALLQMLGHRPPSARRWSISFSRWKAALCSHSLIAIAVGLAPITEEIVFRAGLFRYARDAPPALSRATRTGSPVRCTARQRVEFRATGGARRWPSRLPTNGPVPSLYPSSPTGLFNLNTVVLILSGAVDLGVTVNPFAQYPTQSVAAWGEERLITAIRGWLGNVAPPAPRGMGDELRGPSSSRSQQLLTVDPVILGRHFDETTPPAQVGAKLLKRNVSDIAAMAAARASR
jgi:hypothetical protein